MPSLETISVKPDAPAKSSRWSVPREVSALYERLAGRRAGLVRAIGLASVASSLESTSTAIQLALAAALGGKRTLLVDGQFGNGSVANCFQCSHSPGLKGLLNGQASGAQAICSTELEELFVLPAGSTPSPPLSKKRFSELLEQMSPEYDWLVVDLPPIHSSAGAPAWAGCLDGVILLVEADRKRESEARRATRALQRVKAEVLGIVLI